MAYIESARVEVRRTLVDLGSDGHRIALDIPPRSEGAWRLGAPVTVSMTGDHLAVTPVQQSFEWNGNNNLVSFAVRVKGDAPQGTTLVCFHVCVASVPIAFIPVPLVIGPGIAGLDYRRVEMRVPSSAFASYSSLDAELVTRSLSTLAHWEPHLEVFQDCVDLTPNGFNHFIASSSRPICRG